MSDIQDALKKYWPYLLGGAVGIYFLMGRSSNNTPQQVILSAGGMSDAGYMAQAQIRAAEAQAATEKEYLRMQEEAAIRDYNLQVSVLDAQTRSAADANLSNYLLAQGTAAQGVAQAASGVIASLTAPSIAAINATSAENAYALQSAAAAAAAGYTAISNINLAASEVAGRFADTTHSAYADTTASAVAQAIVDTPTTIQQAGQFTGNMVRAINPLGGIGWKREMSPPTTSYL